METVAEFVRRTQGPAVPFVPDWYPWVYAHHYLRLEVGGLPEDLSRGRTALSASEARDIVQLWCALTGEGIEEAARALADAYLRRWGLVRTGASEASEVSGAGAGAGTVHATVARGGAGRVRRIRRSRRRITVRRARPGSGVLVPAGRRASTGS